MKIVENLKKGKTKIAVVGLGYVGLPLAIEFGKIVDTIGFDISEKRINGLKQGHDVTDESSKEDLSKAKKLTFTNDPAKLREASFIIVAVPTPITKNKIPDLYCCESASELVGKNLAKGAIVVFESTVYPGVTEDICVPIIEKFSGLKCGKDFKIGYSPERINPGDKEHTITKVIKVVSGCDAETTEDVADVYGLVVKAGVFKAQSIKVAEAAKVIENTQRDLNIALMNELAVIFNKMNIDTRSVLEAAGTKWNFIRMEPGLVGGHCIGVDPYYLTFKAEEIGYHPQVILAGRRINDDMGKFIAEQTVKMLINAGKKVNKSKVLVLGVTFKENVKDIRNSKTIDIIDELREYGLDVSVCDPLVDKGDVKHEYGLTLCDFNPGMKFDALVFAVKHRVLKEMFNAKVLRKVTGDGVVVDVKGLFDPKKIGSLGINYWRL